MHKKCFTSATNEFVKPGRSDDGKDDGKKNDGKEIIREKIKS